MAEIDAAISKLISELKKIQGTGAGADATESSGEETNPETAKKVSKIIKDINAQYDKRLKAEGKSIDNAKESLKTARKELKELKETLSTQESISEEEEQQLKTLSSKVNKSKEFVETTRQAAEAANDLGSSFAKIYGGADSLKFEDLLNPKNILDTAKSLGKIIEGQGKMAAVNEMAMQGAMAFTTALVNQTIALADDQANFMKATGASKEFASSISTSFEETRKFGATLQETNAAYQELLTTFTDFTMLSASQRESVAETTTVLAKLGMSNADVAKSIQTSTKALGMSAQQAGQNLLDLEKFAENLGVTPQQMAADFAGAGDMLAKLGSQGTKAFKDLAIAAKTTGMSIESIVNLTNKFDTFEGAADQAGKLNAALGGNFVNSMDLMMATNPAERFEMIRDSLLDTGLTFDEMSYYQKNFFKDSLGLSDVGELAALMSGDMDLVAGATEDSAQSMIEAKKRAQDMATMQEKLNILLTQVIPIIEPFVDKMIELTSEMAEGSEEYAEYIQMIGGLVLGIAGITKAYNTVTAIFEAGNGAVGGLIGKIKDVIIERGADALATFFQAKAQNELNDAQEGGGTSLKKLGKAASKGAKGLLAIGAAALMIGAGIGLAALGTAELVKAFMGLGDAAPYAAIGIGLLMIPFVAFFAAAAVIVYTGVGPAIAGVFLAMGAAALLLGGGIAIAAIGMAQLVTAFTGLAPLIPMMAILPAIFGSLAGSMMLLANPLAIVGMAALTATMLATAAAANLMGEEFAKSVNTITESIEAIPTQKNVEFQASMGALAAASAAAAILGTVNVVTQAMGVGNTTQSKKDSDVYKMELPIVLDGKEIDKKIIELVGGAARDAAAGRGF